MVVDRQLPGRHFRLLRLVYATLHRVLRLLRPLIVAIGYQRLDQGFLALEKLIKEPLLDSQSCGQCILSYTGMICPMNCPKALRNGPCGGVRADGQCEVEPDMTCVWLLAWQSNRSACEGDFPIQQLQPPLDHRLQDTSAWLRDLRKETAYVGPEVISADER